MSNPGSPTPKGRGRGRWKEMSSNERVANWVNQREAKRLNRERWANNVTGSNFPVGDGGDDQMPARQEGAELESSLDRSRAKRQNVPLYVPPSLRAKKESETKKDPSDFNEGSSGAKKHDFDDKSQDGETVNTSAVGISDGSCESKELKSTPRETSRSKGRGRGRKKPEVEIYVPRALRAAKRESKSVSGTQVCDEHKDRRVCTEEIQQNTRPADCNICINALPSKSFTQSPDFSDALIYDNVSQDEVQHHSSSQSVQNCHASDCHSPFSHDSETKKVKLETNSTSVHQNELDAPTSSQVISNEQPQIKTAGNSLTFEFYDPAVVAFLPSTCSVLDYSDTNMSSSLDSSRQTPSVPQVSTTLQPNVTVFSDSSISSDVPAQITCVHNDHLSQISTEKDMEHSALCAWENTRKDSQTERLHPTDTCPQESVPSFGREQISASDLLFCHNTQESSAHMSASVLCDRQNTQESSEHMSASVLCDIQNSQESREQMSASVLCDKQNTQEGSEHMPASVLCDRQNNRESTEILVPEINEYDKPVSTIDSVTYLGGMAHVEIHEDLQAISSIANKTGVVFCEIVTETDSVQGTTPCDSMLQKDLSSQVQLTMQTAEDRLEGPAFHSDKHENNEPVTYHSEKHDNGKPVTYHSGTCENGEPVTFNSETCDNGKPVTYSETREKDKPVSSSDLDGEGGESWDALFDDNGDCLDDTVIKELTEYVGKVEIDKPKINYLNYEPKESEVDYEVFSHILEIYDFSPDLATCDLITAFREFSSRGFDVKWVDDTHALGIFSSSIAAKEALRMMHPLLKVRPLSEASKKGQSKARHCQEFLQPYKARPETTSIAARRLVAGALGMMPQVSKEVRELERKKLKEAKERRRQERQQKVDMWDGSFKKCAMDEENADSR